jgi:hypothetical protein
MLTVWGHGKSPLGIRVEGAHGEQSGLATKVGRAVTTEAQQVPLRSADSTVAAMRSFTAGEQ